MKDLGNYARNKSSAPSVGSSHLRITDPDGDTEDVVLSLRKYVDNPHKAAAKGSDGAHQLSAETTYLALNYDRFYLEDDENGNEQWPVTFPAVSLDDPTDKIEVTFNKDGFMSATSSGKAGGNTASSISGRDVVFAEAVPVVGEEFVVVERRGGGGSYTGCNSGPDNDNPVCRGHAYRGNTGGPTQGIQTHFVINSIRLIATGDGDGASELQMFM